MIGRAGAERAERVSALCAVSLPHAVSVPRGLSASRG